MQIALDAMYPTCGERNCDVRHGLENHHITDYSLVHETRIENIVPLCSYHHDLVTYRGYTLIRGPDGLVDLVAPRPTTRSRHATGHHPIVLAR